MDGLLTLHLFIWASRGILRSKNRPCCYPQMLVPLATEIYSLNEASELNVSFTNFEYVLEPGATQYRGSFPTREGSMR